MTERTKHLPERQSAVQQDIEASTASQAPAASRSISLLSAEPSVREGSHRPDDRSFASDLNLDKIIATIAGSREETEFIATLFYRPVDDVDTVGYRHEVFRDLEDPALLEHIQQFADEMRLVRTHMRQSAGMQYQYQREGWFLDAASSYCDAVQALAESLDAAVLESRALRAFHAFLVDYVASAGFIALVMETKERKRQLEQIRYCTRIRGRPRRRQPLRGPGRLQR